MSLRESLIAAGWKPPAGNPDYEAWRPALAVYQQLLSGPEPNPHQLDSVDREAIDALRAAFSALPDWVLETELERRKREKR